MAGFSSATLAAVGSTGNNTHAGVNVPGSAEQVGVAFKVEAVGTTVDYKVQGSFDGVAFFDLICLPSDSETAAVSATKTTTGTYSTFIAQAHTRFVTQVRLVTANNTGITYSAVVFFADESN